MGLPIKAFSTLSAAVMLQTSVPSSDFVGPIERMTLVSALVIAVTVLWRSNATKDQQIVAMATKVTETMVSVLDAVKELRRATEEVGDAMDNLASNIGAMPCAMDERYAKASERADYERIHGHPPPPRK